MGRPGGRPGGRSQRISATVWLATMMTAVSVGAASMADACRGGGPRERAGEQAGCARRHRPEAHFTSVGRAKLPASGIATPASTPNHCSSSEQ